MLFKRKTKEEKILEDIKKKKEQMDKLKEEIVKMGKLVLKDGKLTKVEDAPKQEQKLEPKATMPEVPQAFTDADVDEMVKQERVRRQQSMATLIDTPQPPRQQPPQLSQEEYDNLRRQQEAYAYQQQLLQQQQAEAQQREYVRQQQELYQQQQYRQQPQQPVYQPQQQIPMVTVSIEMITGTIINVEVTGDKIDSFIEGLNVAIDNQSSFPINNKVVNGRNVVSYTLE